MSYLTTLLFVLGLSLLVFHYLMLRFGPRPLLWKVVDYFWLSVGVSGLIISGANIHLGQTTQELELEEASLSSVHFFSLPSLAWPIHRYSNPPEDFPKDKRWQYELAAQWFMRAEKLINADNLCYELLLNHGYNSTKSSDSLPEIKEDKDRVINIIQSVRERCNKISSLEKEIASVNRFHSLSEYFGPILLAFAIALRITKTTASIKGYT